MQVGAGIDCTTPPSSRASWSCQVSHVLTALILGLIFLLVCWYPLWHTDLWGHLRFGEQIVRQRGWPAHEPFPESMADKEAPYIHFQWLTQVGAYLIFEAGRWLSAPDADHQLGGGALMLGQAHAALVVLRFLLLFWAFQRLTNSPALALAGLVLVLIPSVAIHLRIIRPQILGELGFAAVLFALSRPILSRWALLGVPLVFLIWANCHGSFLMGFVLLGAALVGRVVERVFLEQASCRGGNFSPRPLPGGEGLGVRGLEGSDEKTPSPPTPLPRSGGEGRKISVQAVLDDRVCRRPGAGSGPGAGSHHAQPPRAGLVLARLGVGPSPEHFLHGRVETPFLAPAGGPGLPRVTAAACAAAVVVAATPLTSAGASPGGVRLANSGPCAVFHLVDHGLRLGRPASAAGGVAALSLASGARTGVFRACARP